MERTHVCVCVSVNYLSFISHRINPVSIMAKTIFTSNGISSPYISNNKPPMKGAGNDASVLKDE